jgi:hypothetical protein
MESNFLFVVFFVVFLSINMNGGGRAGGSSAIGGAGVAGSPEGVALVHDTRCQGDFFVFFLETNRN